MESLGFGFFPLKYLWENWPLCKYPHQLSLTDFFSGIHQTSEQEACFSARVECPTAYFTDVSVPQHLLRAPLGWQGSPSSFALGGTCSPGILLLGLLQSEAVSPAGIAQLFICHFTPVEDRGKSPHFCKPLFKYRVMTYTLQQRSVLLLHASHRQPIKISCLKNSKSLSKISLGFEGGWSMSCTLLRVICPGMAYIERPAFQSHSAFPTWG